MGQREGVRLLEGISPCRGLKDFAYPDLQELLPRHLRSKEVTAQERVRIMKLAWEMIGTQFGGRQSMSEGFFAGDPIAGRIIYSGTNRRKECEALAQHLVDSLGSIKSKT